MTAVSRDLALTCANGLNPVDLHQPPDPALANIETHLLQLHRHLWTTIATKAEAVLFPDMGQHVGCAALWVMSVRSRRLIGRERPDR